MQHQSLLLSRATLFLVGSLLLPVLALADGPRHREYDDRYDRHDRYDGYRYDRHDRHSQDDRHGRHDRPEPPRSATRYRREDPDRRYGALYFHSPPPPRSRRFDREPPPPRHPPRHQLGNGLTIIYHGIFD